MKNVWPQRLFFKPLMLLLVIIAAIVGPSSWAQTYPDPREADRQLNQRYQQVMRQLPPAGQKDLRDAQRAWLSFVDKDGRAMRAAAQALGIPLSKCQEVEVEEVRDRTVDFSYQTQPGGGQADQGHLDRVDADLNAVYQRCLAQLPPAVQTSLREAQRAWVEYRDANRRRGGEYIAGLIVRRADQLTDFYITATASHPNKPTQANAGSPPPDPFERAR